MTRPGKCSARWAKQRMESQIFRLTNSSLRMSEGTRRGVHSRIYHHQLTTSLDLPIAISLMTLKEWYSYSSNSMQARESCKCQKLNRKKVKMKVSLRECSTLSSRSALPVRTPPQTFKIAPLSNKTSLSGCNQQLRSSQESWQQLVLRTRVRPELALKRKTSFFRAAARPSWLQWLSSSTTLAKLSKALSLVLKVEKSSSIYSWTVVSNAIRSRKPLRLSSFSLKIDKVTFSMLMRCRSILW